MGRAAGEGVVADGLVGFDGELEGIGAAGIVARVGVGAMPCTEDELIHGPQRAACLVEGCGARVTTGMVVRARAGGVACRRHRPGSD